MGRIVKERCPHCNKKMENIGTTESPQWVCYNHPYPIYVPPLANVNSVSEENEDE